MAGDNVKTLRIKPPLRGFDSEASPAYVDADHAVLLENFLPTRRGKLSLRGELSLTTTAAGGFVQVRKNLGYMTADNSAAGGLVGVLLPGYDSSAKLRIDDLKEPLVSSTQNIASGSTAFIVTTQPVQLGTKSYAGARRDSGTSNWQVFQWGSGLIAPTANAFAPFNPRTLCAHLGRLWVVGAPAFGTGAGTSAPATLFWSDIGGPTAGVQADWEDDVSGLRNQIDVDQVTADPINGLAKIGRYMAILRQNSIWMLYGDTSATFSVRRIVGGIGAMGGSGSVTFWPSTLEVQDGVVFVGTNGNVYLFNGTEIILLSERWQAFGQENLPSRYSISFASIDHEWFIMCASDSSNTPTSLTPIVKLCHLPTRAWMDFTASASLLDSGLPQLVGNAANGVPFMHDGVSKLSIIRNPRQNKSLVVPVGNRDVDNGGTVRALPARFWSRVHILGAPLQKSFIKRVAMEYSYAVTSGTPSPGLTLQLYDRQGNALTTAQTVSSSGTMTQQRFEFSPFVEASDVQVRVEYSDSSGSPAATEIEISDIWIEYQETRQSL